MTVEQLIEELKKYPKDMPVYIEKNFDEYELMLAMDVKEGCLAYLREFDDSISDDEIEEEVNCVIITDTP